MNENDLADEQLPEHLDELGDLIEHGWCQGIYARDKDGKKINELSDKAVCFCISGGIMRISEPHGRHVRRHMRAALEKTLTLQMAADLPERLIGPKVASFFFTEGGLIGWNDKADRSREQVVKLCRDAAQRLRAS